MSPFRHRRLYKSPRAAASFNLLKASACLRISTARFACGAFILAVQTFFSIESDSATGNLFGGPTISGLAIQVVEEGGQQDGSRSSAVRACDAKSTGR